MTSSKSWLPEAALLWLPLLVLVGGLAVVWTGVSMAVDVHRSAGLFPGREIVPGRRVQIRVWPDERRAELDDGDKHTPVIVAGSLLTLLGAGGTVLLFRWHHGVRLGVKADRWQTRFDACLWWLSRWR
ncbi:hypothetical protein [Amycolatopsis sp. lyj-109]|uniref:hypothetical protein n=1 Tax=Amycolatopsis sp. lyj-109 TaxID=2789287 RepID=UPI003979B8A2